MAGQDEGIDNFEYAPANQCFAAKHTTMFGVDFDMDQMKEMVRSADPATVKSVSRGWADLHNDLVGSGGIKETLDAAVEHVLAHWEGQSADLFKQRAQLIAKKITNSATYAQNVSQSLTGAAVILERVQPTVLAMEKPGTVSSGMDFLGNMGHRDASATDASIRKGGSSQEALDNNAGSLSEGREAQLKMAAQMEILGAAYNSRAAEMGSWSQKLPIKPGGRREESEEYPPDPGGAAPAPVVVPTEFNPRSPKAVASSTARRGQVGAIGSSKPVAPPSGVTGGAHKPTTTQPQVGTAIDGISGGRTGGPTIGGTGTVGGVSATGGGVGGVGGGAGFVGGAVGGAAGARAGAAGMAGRAGAGGAGAAKGGAGGRVGGAARNGVVGGTPKSGAGAGAGGRGTAGGSGLHGSRGAAGRGASAVRKGGMVGAPGGRKGRPEDEEQRENERPDYLVEDEETWAPHTDVAPRVIE
ncbi:WXG100 family type VII secretion target [Streptomyces sp. NPDC019531]|uniref:WXG100 family type VII secretion target n=1 Tax=Streptomyces sp. NPDC019531 TaxID=3365062 RepID=UPI00384EF202